METNKINKLAVGVLVASLFLNMLQTCSSSSTKKVVNASTKKVDSLETVLTKVNLTLEKMDKQFPVLIEIEGLKTSSRTLYDWNSVIRTVNRPDDVMKSYSDKIEKLEKSLK